MLEGLSDLQLSVIMITDMDNTVEVFCSVLSTLKPNQRVTKEEEDGNLRQIKIQTQTI